MALECKNIRENFPILISCVPRHEPESYHQIAIVGTPKTNPYNIAGSFHQSRATTLRITQHYSIYKDEEPVGKSTAQIGRALDSTISVNDTELYEKWGQCLSSIGDLVRGTYWDGDDNDENYYSTVFPFVVVPNERLWMVTYDKDGNRTSDPIQTNRCSCYIDKDYEMGMINLGVRKWLYLSHIEIVTFEGLKAFVEKYLQTEEGMEYIFPKDGILEAFKKGMKK